MWQSLTAPFSSSWSAFQNSLSNCLLADTLPQGIRKVLLRRVNKRWVGRSSYKRLVFTMEDVKSSPNIFQGIYVAQNAILSSKHLKSHPIHYDFMLSRGDLSAKSSHPKAEFLFVALHAEWAWSSAFRSAQVGLHVLRS